ncbi:MAG TPA: M56 family metallopeptidase [Longimicrobiales bacterium]
MSASSWLLAEVLSVVVRTTMLVVVAEMVARAFARRPAAVRHAVWAAALLAVIVVPLSSLLRLPPLVVLQTSIVAERSVADINRASKTVDGNATSSPLVTPDQSKLWDSRDSSPAAHTAGRILLLVWAAGALLVLLRFARAHRTARRLAHRAVPHRDPTVLRVWAGVCARHDWRGVEIRASDEISTPATVGVWRCIVLLPAAMSWDVRVLEAVLEHELAHVRRRDGAVQLIAQLAMALHWYHPLVARAARMLAGERERSCDDVVLTSGVVPVRYAEVLLWAARRARVGLPPAPALALGGTNELEDRLHAILEQGRSRGALSRRAIAGCLTTAVLLAVVMSAVQLDAARDAHGERAVLESNVIAALQTPKPGTRLPAPEPDLRGDSVAAPRTELIRLSAGAEHRAAAAGSALLNGPDSAVARVLVRALQHEPQADDDLIRDRSTWALLMSRDGRLLTPIVDALADGNWRVRAYAAWTLGVAGGYARSDDRAVTRLVSLLDDPIWRVRSAAAFALLHIADGSAAPAMRRALGDAAWQVRMPAVQFLGRYGDENDRIHLRRLLTDRHVAVRQAAADALALPQ